MLSDDQSFIDGPWVWQLGRVKSLTDTEALIEFDSVKQCQPCLSGQGCGAGVFSQLFSRRGSTFAFAHRGELSLGQWVRVGVSPKAIILASVWVYGWPLLLFVGALSVGHYGFSLCESTWGEWGLLLLASGLAGLGLVLIGRLRSRLMNPIVIPWSCTKKHSLTDD